MKRILIIFSLLVLSIPAFSQVYTVQDNPATNRQARGGFEALTWFRFPVEGGHSIPAGDSLWFVRVNPNDGQVYMWNGLTWGCISCGGGGTVDTTLFVKYSDTANMLTGYTRVQRFLDSILAVRNLANSKQNQLNGTGFVKASGTTISYDNSTYTPTGRTITINGIAQDLSADRTWTIPVVDTTSLSNRIDGKLSTTDTGAMLTPYLRKVDTTGKWLPASTYIPDTISLSNRIDGKISFADTGSLVATPYQIDTATSRIWQMKVDTMWVSSDTFYWQRGQDVFFIVGMGGGGLDTTAGDARYWKQGGNAASSTLVWGTTNNQDVNIIHNNVIRNGIRPQYSFISNRLSVGKATNVGDVLEVVGYVVITSGGIAVDGNSSSTGFVGRWRNSSNTVVAQFNNNNTVQFNSLAGTGTGVVTADDGGVLSIQRPPASGTYVLKSVDGVIQWIAE